MNSRPPQTAKIKNSIVAVLSTTALIIAVLPSMLLVTDTTTVVVALISFSVLWACLFAVVILLSLKTPPVWTSCWLARFTEGQVIDILTTANRIETTVAWPRPDGGWHGWYNWPTSTDPLTFLDSGVVDPYCPGSFHAHIWRPRDRSLEIEFMMKSTTWPDWSEWQQLSSTDRTLRQFRQGSVNVV